MKANIHPKWYADSKVTCICGNTFTVGSTVPEIALNTCSKCHPFFTGEQKFVDTEGRVEKFQKKQKHAQESHQMILEKKKRKEERAKLREKSLREMLLGV